MPFSYATLDNMAGDILANLDYWSEYSAYLFSFSDVLTTENGNGESVPMRDKQFWRLLRNCDQQIDHLWSDYQTVLSFVM